MTAPVRNIKNDLEASDIENENLRVLRRLAEPGALLIVAPDMERAVILRGTVRTAVLERALARDFALRDWIQVVHEKRVTSYELTGAGRAALR